MIKELSMKFTAVALTAMFAVAVTTSLAAQDGANLYKKDVPAVTVQAEKASPLSRLLPSKERSWKRAKSWNTARKANG
jgi:hypothetical protein